MRFEDETTLTIGANEQLVLDDIATELFGVTNGKGGVSISSDVEIFGSARIYNDQSATGAGTRRQSRGRSRGSKTWRSGPTSIPNSPRNS